MVEIGNLNDGAKFSSVKYDIKFANSLVQLWKIVTIVCSPEKQNWKETEHGTEDISAHPVKRSNFVNLEKVKICFMGFVGSFC